MRLHIPILALVLGTACALAAPLDAQSRRLPGSTKSAKSAEKHARSLMKIAADLRKAGQHDVADKVAGQARRLMQKDRPKSDAGRTERETGRRRSDRRAVRADSWGRTEAAPKADAKSKSKSAKSQSKRKDKADKSDKADKAPRVRWTTRRRPPGASAPESAPRPDRASLPARSPRSATAPTKRRARTAPLPDPAAGPAKVRRWAVRPRAPEAPALPRRPMVAPPTKDNNYVRIPQVGNPDASDARVDLGRERFRYTPVPTARDDQGRVVWRGLPPAPPVEHEGWAQFRIARKRAEAAQNRAARIQAGQNQTGPARGDSLQRRVDALADEVRAMREKLDELKGQLRTERRKRLIR